MIQSIFRNEFKDKRIFGKNNLSILFLYLSFHTLYVYSTAFWPVGNKQKKIPKADLYNQRR